MKLYNHHKLNSQGAVLISVVITLPFLMLIAFNYTRLSANNINVAQKDQFQTKAQMTADAGIDYAMQQINIDTDWNGTGSEIVFDTTNNVKTTYEITVNHVSDEEKIITTTGRTYRPASDITPKASVVVNTDLRPVSSGDFSIVTGVGGLVMENSAKVLGGSVFVNGTVDLSNTAQIGLALTPVTLNVAHQSCPNPADVTYPRLCTSGENGEPITISNQAHIYGDVTANNQTTTTGMSDTGLIGSSGVTPEPLPPHDRDAQKLAATNNMGGGAASCTTNNGSVTWPANTKITGDVVIEKNNCTVTIEGDVWITGDLTMTQSGKIQVDDSVGTTRPNLMVDGDTVRLRNTAGIVNNADDTGVQLISYYSTASCSPDCTDVTGTDLQTSRIHEGIDLDNSAFGPGTIFYARWTKVIINNSGEIGALIGQTVHLKNSGTITFGATVGTGTSYWILDGYRRAF